MSMHVKPRRMLSTRNVQTLRLQVMAAEYMKAMGERIASARQAKGWNQPQLARAVEQLRREDDPDASSIEGSSISRYEKGKVEPNSKMKEYLARALDVDVSYFLTPPPDKSHTPDLSRRPTSVEDRLANMERILRVIAAAVGLTPAALQAEVEALAQDEASDPEHNG